MADITFSRTEAIRIVQKPTATDPTKFYICLEIDDGGTTHEVFIFGNPGKGPLFLDAEYMEDADLRRMMAGRFEGKTFAEMALEDIHGGKS